jgi:hypothetical protein
VTRRIYYVDLGPETAVGLEPQPTSCPSGDLLTNRIYAGVEILLVHEKTNMRVCLNGMLRDYGIFPTVYHDDQELGNGTLACEIPIGSEPA